MNITIPSNATTASIKNAHPVPRGASHFRFTAPGRKPVVDAIKNLDTLAGCSGKLEYGKVQFEGRGRYAKIKAFTPMSVATAHTPAATPKAPTASVPPPVSKARKPQIFGFSACAAAKALGKAGVKYAEADRIFRAHGIEMPKASLSVQIGFGRNPESWERHGKPADLSDAQIVELRGASTK